MVLFVRSKLGQRQHLTVRAISSGNGTRRVVVDYPSGLKRLHYFSSNSALLDGTTALQAELTAQGWKPNWASTRLTLSPFW